MKHRFCCALICCALLFSRAPSAGAAGTATYPLGKPDVTALLPSSDSSLAACANTADSAMGNAALQAAKSESAQTGPYTYTDPKTKTMFTVPENWAQTPLSKEREFIDVKFTSLEQDDMNILYSSFDLWSEMTASERSGYNRSDIDNSVFTSSDIADLADYLGLSSDDIYLVTYGGKEYYTASHTSSGKVNGLTIMVSFTYMILINNGYGYYFQFGATLDGSDDIEGFCESYEDFESLLSSVSFAASASGNGFDLANYFSVETLLLNLIATITIYSLPIILYRYAIRKAPVDKKKAKIIATVYGVCAFFIMSALLYAINGSGVAGGAIFLWSWVNYRMLIGGKKPEPSPAEIPMGDGGLRASEPNGLPQGAAQIAADSVDREAQLPSENGLDPKDSGDLPSDPEINYCHKCGHKLRAGSSFCNQCGISIG